MMRASCNCRVQFGTYEWWRASKMRGKKCQAMNEWMLHIKYCCLQQNYISTSTCMANSFHTLCASWNFCNKRHSVFFVGLSLSLSLSLSISSNFILVHSLAVAAAVDNVFFGDSKHVHCPRPNSRRLHHRIYGGWSDNQINRKNGPIRTKFCPNGRMWICDVSHNQKIETAND